ncbi:MAG: hypothetical protein IJT89_02395 [Bacteroidaceae bacterium]|nr:hypothetical protein [Bacteroidaceae bacterium]
MMAEIDKKKRQAAKTAPAGRHARSIRFLFRGIANISNKPNIAKCLTEKSANNQVNMADLRLSANILFAQSIREKENSKELSFLSRIIYAVLSRETYPDSRKDMANIQTNICK